MKLWPLFFVILLAGQPAAAELGSTDGTKDIELGENALAGGLWEIATLHFRASLEAPALDEKTKAAVAIRLAESLIRGGSPVEALELLERSFVSGQPAAGFWKAQAFAADHRFGEAVEIFRRLLADETSPHRMEAGFTAASLQLALGKPDDALATLAQLLSTADSPAASRIRLQQVEILLDLGRTAEAREAMPATASVSRDDIALAAFLAAELTFAEGDAPAAQAAFQELVNQPQGQSLIRHHSAAIGLAETIAAQGQSARASASLLAFLQSNPNSPVLEPVFKHLLEWLPDAPAANDPTLDAMSRWIPDQVFPAVLPLDAAREGAVATWPVVAGNPADSLTPYAMYLRGIGLHRLGTAEAQAESRRLLERLRWDFPEHPLAQRALYQTARWKVDEGKAAEAFGVLEILRETAKLPEMRGQAAYLEARAAFVAGDSEQAIERFAEAAAHLDGADARRAKLQEAIAALRGGKVQTLELIQADAAKSDPQLAADMELEQALAATPPATAQAALVKFLADFPEHPRADEARIAAVEAALSTPKPDVDFARNELALLARRGVGGSRVALAQVQNLAAEDPLSARSQVAWLLAARSAAQGGTPKSKEEALAFFDNAIAADGPLRPLATLEKASHLFDMSRLAEASEFLTQWIATLAANDPLQVPAGLLLGGALYAQGSSNPDSLSEALVVYDGLMEHAKEQPALFYRLQFLRGTTLELLPDPADPSKKRETEAFEAYHSVLETTKPPADWEYFERCGFRALALLEKAKRWQAAVTIARKIAAFQGPRAAEAAARASKIQLEQMIW